MNKTLDQCDCAMPENQTDSKRRSILRLLLGSSIGLGFTALGTAASLWAAGLARFLFPNVVVASPTKFKVGVLADYPPEHIERKFAGSHGVWIIRAVFLGKDQIYALSSVCTHLGCIVNWQENEQRFKCPCHGSGFRKDGVNFEGPAPRPLERFAIHLAEDGQLEVDKSRIFREELGQWQDPAASVLA